MADDVKKTLLFTLEYPPFAGGVANYYANLAAHWPEAGKLEVLADLEGKWQTSRIRPRWLPLFFGLCGRLWGNNFGHLIVGQILPLGWVAYHASLIARLPYTVVPHGLDFSLALKSPRKRRQTRRILRRARHIVCANSHTAQLVKDFLGQKQGAKVATVNPGVDPRPAPDPALLARLRDKYALRGQPLLLSVGRLVKRKGFDSVLQALPEIQSALPELCYFIAGDGPDKEYIHHCAQGRSNVYFLGEIDDAEKWAWFSLADVFIMPAREIDGDYEGFGIVYLEAAVSGLPVIAGNSGGVKDAVEAAVTGIVVDSLDIDRLANAVITLVTNQELAGRLAAAAKERALQRFGWAELAKRFHAIVTAG